MPRADFSFCHQLRVRYAEVDAQGVVFNAHYLTYFDVAHTEYLRAAGYDYAGEIRRTGLDFHLVRSVVEYRRPLVFDQLVDVCVRAARIGRTSVTNLFEIHASGEDALLASGETVLVCADLATHRPVPVMPGLLEAMRRMEGGRLEEAARPGG
ncbi:MAG: YbgC/FadM family acyl-CoA thioesterase [Alphaproteobacteria bacterium]|nr:YbgC/FadM family acyl-CoA thioesterase [Alphaproteobacteria bacterium]